LLLSTLMSALAGVSWYLIFMRWSKRETGGRAGENQLETQIASSNEGLIVRRGAVETSAPWSEVKLKRENRDALILSIAGAGTVLVPRRWAEAGRDFDTLVDRLKSQGANNA
ncbi:MAG: YcxB family protein, partial [Pseudomonadota bacterium]